ncbi:glycerol-3-phosphate dehydrogenase/oxidase [Candidatus Actinomarina sp.]|nr:glycerol-3-phosphate dehydrogenase/oxidase [Candidatus Actinomarina sp.]MDA9197493.1 glycerol-3-phosphate dehydrogenase/oxidase [Acidimicrobiia bacterium]MDA8667818.1 glycerol-3-phosphate dehydrogenase/oxidase [Candidatus Actinomarina sp.]MDA9860107.1 glycerol-3-phosphate dehydrogenase/oxidase [Acidimicrobiia bacterium]MDC1039992.1 glycerol-3-phosphate dehydrogenase/oxidase [Acidimicrobiia bacterium]
MNFSRLDQIHSLEENNKFELLVIGGGVVGSAILELAASQGINSLLIEKNDFSSGASSRSTKLLHGGIRYLPQMQFGLVRESLKEQKILEQVLGKLYKPLKLLAPVFKDNGFSDLPRILQSNFIAPIAFKIGLTLYDFLGQRKKDQRHTLISKEDTFRLFPKLKKNKLTKSFIFQDAQTEDAKLVLTLLRNAVEINNATALNYVKITDIIRTGDMYKVSLIDDINKKKYTVESKKIIAATGIHNLPGTYESKSSKIKLSGGAHLILEGDPLGIGKNGVLLPQTEDNRVMFVLPWTGNTIVGTTDTEEFSGSLDRPYANSKDKDYLIRHIKKYFNIDEVKYISSWTGLRALIDSSGTNSKNISRGHFYKNIDENFIQISGGKLTGFRVIAKESLEQLFSQNFELNKQEFVDSILNLESQFNYKDLQLCLNHYCVVKPTDYLLRRTRISWFNQNGGKSFLDKVMVHFDSTLYFEQTIEELKDEGLL